MLDQILDELDSLLDDYVYKKIWESLSKQDKKVLLAMNDDDATKTKDISKKSGIKTESLSKYRERLMKKGLIHSSEHGYLEMTLPRFRSVITKYV